MQGATKILPTDAIDMPFARRMLYTPVFHLDTNLINAKQRLAEVNRLENWAANEVILIIMSGVAHAEAQADGNPHRVKKAATHIFTIHSADEGDESDATAGETDQLLAKVEATLFECGAQNDNQHNDVRIVCEAIKYQATLVTNDGASKSQPGGILGNRTKLKAFANIEIMSPAEAVSFVEKKIAERDGGNVRMAQETGKTLPAWTGTD